MFWNIQVGSPVAIIQAHDGPCNSIDVWGDHFLSGGGYVAFLFINEKLH